MPEALIGRHLLIALMLLLAAPIELRTRHIPNWLTLSGIVATVPVGLLAGSVLAHVLSLVAITAIGMPLFRRKVIHGGMLKLAMAVAGVGGLTVAAGLLVGLPLIAAAVAIVSRTDAGPGTLVVGGAWLAGLSWDVAVALGYAPAWI